jgi:hypothetical protein
VRTLDVLRSVRNVRYTAADVRQRNGLSVELRVLRQCRVPSWFLQTLGFRETLDESLGTASGVVATVSFLV